jgi:acetamidase/formamidase/AraC-like DNA-binding protein
MSSSVSIEAIPQAHQMYVWREALAILGLDCSSLAGAPVSSGQFSMLEAASGARLALMRATAQEITCAGAAAARPQAARIAILFHGYGRGVIAAHERSREFAEGDISICELHKTWKLTLREDFELLVLDLPRARLWNRLGHRHVELPLVLGAGVAAAAARPLMRTLAANFSELDPSELISTENAAIELLAGALLARSRCEAETATQAAHLRRVFAAIEARLGDAELSMADIARGAALSQRYLQRLFEHQDTTFSHYVRERRLERCRIDLTDPMHADDSIAEIAFRWGFRDQAYFSRAFSAAFGCSPREFRKTVPRIPDSHPTRGRPLLRTVVSHLPARSAIRPAGIVPARIALAVNGPDARARHHLAVCKDTVHWGYLSRAIPPVLRVGADAHVVIETLTQHAYDDYERMIAGDAGAESVFRWTAEGKAVDRRGAGPMKASIFGRGAGEGFGVHICTGPIYVDGASPGDVLEVQILDIRPRPCANPQFAGKAFGSNAAAWWGFQYDDLIDKPARRETITIYETDLTTGARFARALYSYRWTPQIDPFGVRHDTMDYPGLPVDHATIEKVTGQLSGVRVPARLHFGFMAVAPREADLVDSIPPGYFGGNVDNWRAGKGTTLYLPVAVPGALFSVGDPHFAQGDGEIDGTALEFSLTGEFRLVLHKKGGSAKPFLEGLTAPLLETGDAWVLNGFSYPNYLRELGRYAQSEVYKKSSVDLALRNAFRAARRFLMERYGLSEDEAISLLSVAVDFGVTQVADGNWGVHAVIPKGLFAGP